MNQKKVYIILTDTGTLFTRMIKSYTNKPYNHASISFDTDLFQAYSFGRKTTKNPFVGGFVHEDMKTTLFQQASCVIYSYTVSDVQMQMMYAYIRKIEERKQFYKYNFLGLFALIINKPWNRKNAFFCSQFVASLLTECGVLDFQKPVSLVTPHDLLEAGNFQMVYQGTFEGYHQEKGLVQATLCP